MEQVSEVIEKIEDFRINGDLELQLVGVVLAFILIYAILRITKSVIIAKAKNLAANTSVKFDYVLVDSIDTFRDPFFLITSIAIAKELMPLPPTINNIINISWLAITALFGVIAIRKLLHYLIDKIITSRSDGTEGADGDDRGDDRGDDGSEVVSVFLKQFSSIVIWIVAILLVLQNMGVEITALLGGIGIAGLAIGFAIQNILEDIFAFFTIYFDKPFRKGDFIIVGEDMGTVQNIGLKSTRIKTLQGQEMVISNKELTSIRINNFRQMQERRVVFEFEVTYETPGDSLREIPTLFGEIMDGIDVARLDRIHFKEFADSGLVFEVVYYIENKDFNTYMDVQQKINLDLKERLEKINVEFAYPTRRVLVDKVD